MQVPKANDSPVQLTQKNFTAALNPIPAYPELRALGQRPLLLGEIRMQRRKLGDRYWLAAASRPEIRARMAQVDGRANPHRR